MPYSARVARWSGRSRRASNPPWIAGCNVLTLPSSISGMPVTSATSVTGSPASAIVRAELPVEISATPCAVSPRANGTMPVLSLTEISARRIGREVGKVGNGATPDYRNARRYRAAYGWRQGRLSGAAPGCRHPEQQHQNRDAGTDQAENRPAVLGGPAAADQHQVRRDDPPHDRGMAEPALGRALVEMLAMRLPHPLAAR